MTSSSPSYPQVLDPSAELEHELERPDLRSLSQEQFCEKCDEVERLSVSDPGSATEQAQRLVKVADAIGLPRLRVRARRALAQANAYSGRFDEALRVCKTAIEIGLQSGQVVETARARMASLHALASLGRFDEAIAAGQTARLELVGEGEPELIARVDLNLGAVCAMNDDPTAALAYFDRAKPALVEQTTILAQLETNRGNALAALDDYTGAEAAFASAVASFEVSRQPLAAAIAEGNRGHLAARRGLIQQALGHFERSRRMLDQSDAKSHRARLLAEYAEVVATLGLTGDAIESLEHVIPELDESSQRIEAARARVALARAYISLEQFETAIPLVAAALSVFADLDQSVDLGRAQLTAAGLALQTGEIASASGFVAHALNGLANRPADLALASTVAALVHLRSGEIDLATAEIETALQISQRLELAPIEAEAHLLKGRSRRARGEPALLEFSLAVERTEQIRGTLQAGIFRSAFQSDRTAAYVELFAEAIRNPGPESISLAFRASELNKSRGLLDVIDAGGMSVVEMDDAQPAADFDLQVKLNRVREELNWRYSRMAESTDLQTQRSTRSLEFEVQRLELQRSSAALSGRPGLATVELSDALTCLPATSMAISYTFVEHELVALVLRHGECSVHRGLSTVAEINGSLRRLRLQISRAHAHGSEDSSAPRLLADVRRELNILYSMLLQPVLRPNSDVENIVIVPGGPLHMVPFAALWNESQYLLEKLSVSILPSMSLYSRLAAKPVAQQCDSRLLVGVSDERAPQIEDEIKRIARMSNHYEVLLESNATVDRVKALLPAANTLHFACHGRFSRVFPNASGLKLADRWLTVAEISRLDLRGAHVTLSACDTGRSARSGVDEFVGLSSGFYAAGARSMILSLWPVDDAHTVELMTECYQRQNKGISIAASLRQAQLNAINRGVHPAHWAAFTFGGRS